METEKNMKVNICKVDNGIGYCGCALSINFGLLSKNYSINGLEPYNNPSFGLLYYYNLLNCFGDDYRCILNKNNIVVLFIATERNFADKWENAIYLLNHSCPNAFSFERLQGFISEYFFSVIKKNNKEYADFKILEFSDSGKGYNLNALLDSITETTYEEFKALYYSILKTDYFDLSIYGNYSNIESFIDPLNAEEKLQLDIVCDKCDEGYSDKQLVINTDYYDILCSLKYHFSEDAPMTIRKAILDIDSMRVPADTRETSLDAVDASISFRPSIAGNALYKEYVVTAPNEDIYQIIREDLIAMHLNSVKEMSVNCLLDTVEMYSNGVDSEHYYAWLSKLDYDQYLSFREQYLFEIYEGSIVSVIGAE